MIFKDISIQEFKNKPINNFLIIDIRDRDSYNNGKIPNAKNYNSEDIINLSKQNNKECDILIYCYHGNSSRKVASFLSESGFQKVYSLIGGFSEWKNSL